MPAPLSKAEIAQRVDAIHEALRAGHKPDVAPRVAAQALGMTSNSFRNWLADALERGQVSIDWSLYQPPKQVRPKIEPAAPPPQGPSAPPTKPGVVVEDTLVAALRKQALTLDEVAAKFGVTKGAALDALDGLRAKGLNIHQAGDRFSLTAAPAPAHVTGRAFEYVSRPDNTFLFGATSDNHLCSKFERLDVVNDLYDRFERAGVDRVFNAGNWIDGEMSFNQFEIKVHGMEDQCRYLAEHYPRRSRIKTYAIAGEDHEGFYCRRESIDIGRFAERIMQEAGRDDWVDLGFIEAKIDLVNANTGARSTLVVMHPGGGSSYAVSYRPQKIIESLEGGEKPAVLLIGHYHKLSVNLIRNVWTMQIGCTEDQTVFMRKKNIDAHIGGMIIGLEQDPETGAIIGCAPQIYRYFNQDYYNDRWKRVGDVVLPERKYG